MRDENVTCQRVILALFAKFTYNCAGNRLWDGLDKTHFELINFKCQHCRCNGKIAFY